jgi:myosin heavy subunit
LNRRTGFVSHVLVVAALALTACGREAEQRAIAAEARLAQMDTIAAAKDSLMQEMISTSSFIGELNEELHKLESAGKKKVVFNERVMPIEEYRANMMTRVKELNTRVVENEKKLRSTQARLKKLAAHDAEMTARVAAYDSMIVGYKQVIETQRAQIADLTLQVDTLSADNLRLTNENKYLAYRQNTAYYVVGSKKELMEKGVVAEVGGSRVLGIGWRTGETLVPAHNLNAEVFHHISKQEALEIPLPDPNKKYKLVSRQNIAHVELKPESDGTFQGSIKITDPRIARGP